MDSSSDNSTLDKILNYLRNIDDRVSKIEERLDIQTTSVEPTEIIIEESQVKIEKSNEGIEERIGQFWLPRIGIVVFIVGLAFILSLPHKGLPVFLPSVMGYFFTAILFGLAKYRKNSLKHLSDYLISSGFVSLYFSSMRLYFFGFEKAIDSISIIVILLLIVSAINLVMGFRKNSANLVGLGITLGFVTALLSDGSYFIFLIITLLSIIVVLFKLKNKTNFILFYGITLAYLTHLIWFINNPLLGNTLQTVSEPEINLVFILVYALIFSFAYLFSNTDDQDDFVSASASMFNCGAGYGLLVLITLLTSSSLFSLYHLLAALLFLAIAIANWIKKENKYSTFFYAMTGYAALSIAIIGQFDRPDYFYWLCWQSLMVVSTAVWFRSKFIIVANFIIYLMIFFGYLIVSESIGGISFSFGIVALLSARILSWKKDQLELKTEQMRNAYLLSALFIIPYALYLIFPSGYVSLTWVFIAVIYYILSIILKSDKYRWMALATFFLTVLYVSILGITSTETFLKILSFLVLGATLIIISVVYAKKKGREKAETSSTKKSDD